MIRRSSALIAVALALGSCGTPPRVSAPHADPERGYAALRWVPAEATYAVAGAHTRDLVAATRELLTAVGLFGEWSVGDLHRELRSTFSISPLSDDDLATIGIDPERSAAAFSVGLFPTLVLPVRDKAELVAYFDRQRPAKGVSVTRAQGVDVYSYGKDEDLAVDWAILDDWMFVHVRNPRMEKSATAWMERVLGVPAGKGFAASPELARAIDAARAQLPAPVGGGHELIDEPPRVHPGVVGVIDVDRVWKRLADLLPKGVRACRAGLASGGRVVFAADMSWRAGEGAVIVPLAKASAAELRAQLTGDVPAGFRRYRADSAISLDVHFDLAWLSGLAARRESCALLPRLPRGSVERVGGGAVRGYHIAGRDLAPSKARGQLAVFLAGAEPAFVQRLLDKIPLRATIERDAEIHGVPVKVIDLPSLPPAAYRVQPASLTVGVGRGVMAELLDDAPYQASEGRGATVLAATIRPGLLPEIQATLQRAARFFGVIGRGYFERTEQRLSRYERGRLRVALDGDSVVVRVAMKLR